MSAVHTPFDLQDKIEERDISGALHTLSVILRNGMRSASGKLETDAHSIAAILLGMFRERVRLSAQVALLLWEKQGDDYIRNRLNVRSAFYLNKLKDSARRLTAAALKSMNEALHDAERRIKRKGHLAVPVLEETVIRLARAGK
jgi:DNA polymerase III delta subunit